MRNSGFPDSSADKESSTMLEIPGSGGIGYLLQYSWASLVTQMIQNLSAMWGELGSVPGLGRSLGGAHGNPF